MKNQSFAQFLKEIMKYFDIRFDLSPLQSTKIISQILKKRISKHIQCSSHQISWEITFKKLTQAAISNPIKVFHSIDSNAQKKKLWNTKKPTKGNRKKLKIEGKNTKSCMEKFLFFGAEKLSSSSFLLALSLLLIFYIAKNMGKWKMIVWIKSFLFEEWDFHLQQLDFLLEKCELGWFVSQSFSCAPKGAFIGRVVLKLRRVKDRGVIYVEKILQIPLKRRNLIQKSKILCYVAFEQPLV